jgi:hypothetical protein
MGHLVSSAELHLQTLFECDAAGRILCTREPGCSSGPAFSIVRSREKCAWAVHSQVNPSLAAELDRLAAEESPARDFQDPPMHAARYMALLGEDVYHGPALAFPETIIRPSGIEFIESLDLLMSNFRGWTALEIPDRQPIAGVVQDNRAVSICFCARRSDVAAEAGLETAAPFRGRGLGARVTAAWAIAIRETGRIPLYSTSWSNHSSLAVARKLRLVTYASNWSVRLNGD